MRKNPVKESLRAGNPAFGTMVFEFFTPGIAQIVRAAGAEFILFDMEHSGVGMETLKACIATCRGIGLTPLVRIPTLQYHFISRCLDIGAMGIMVPMVERRHTRAKSFPPPAIHPPAGAAWPSDLPMTIMEAVRFRPRWPSQTSARWSSSLWKPWWASMRWMR